MDQLFKELSGAYIVGRADDIINWVEAYPYWYYDSDGGIDDYWTDNYN